MLCASHWRLELMEIGDGGGGWVQVSLDKRRVKCKKSSDCFLP